MINCDHIKNANTEDDSHHQLAVLACVAFCTDKQNKEKKDMGDTLAEQTVQAL